MQLINMKNKNKKIKIGFFKKPQGIFTKEFIKEIEEDLSSREGTKVFSGLDYKKGFVVNGDVFVGDFNLSELDVYFWHGTVDVKIWKGDNYYLNLLKALEKKCVVVNSSDSTRTVNDKYFSHLLLKQDNLPVADFALVNISNIKAAKHIYNSFGKEVLIKPRFRGFGMGIVRITTEEQLVETLELLQSYLPNGEEQVLLEKFYSNDITKWISVVVLGDKVILGYRKKILSDSTWKVYDPERKDVKGEFTEYVKPSQGIGEIALKAKKIIGKDIICFDFIYTEEGYKIIDENGRPGLYAHCLREAKIDIKKEIVDLIISKIEKNDK